MQEIVNRQDSLQQSVAEINKTISKCEADINHGRTSTKQLQLNLDTLRQSKAKLGEGYI